MRTAAALSGLVGGLAWILALVLDEMVYTGFSAAVAGTGFALLAVAVLAAGAGLVSRSATSLRVIVAVCLALLVWSVLKVLSDGIDERLVRAVAGLGAAAVAGVVLSRRPPPAPEPARRATAGRTRGSHAR